MSESPLTMYVTQPSFDLIYSMLIDQDGNIDQSQIFNERDSLFRRASENWAKTAVANDEFMAKKSVTKLILLARPAKMAIEDHIWPRQQIKGPRGSERDTTHRFQWHFTFGWLVCRPTVRYLYHTVIIYQCFLFFTD